MQKTFGTECDLHKVNPTSKSLQGNKAQIWALLIAKADRKKAEAIATPSKLKFELAKNTSAPKSGVAENTSSP